MIYHWNWRIEIHTLRKISIFQTNWKIFFCFCLKHKFAAIVYMLLKTTTSWTETWSWWRWFSIALVPSLRALNDGESACADLSNPVGWLAGLAPAHLPGRSWGSALLLHLCISEIVDYWDALCCWLYNYYYYYYSHHAWAGTADSKSKSKELCPKGHAKSFKF